jgi:hypothetical protein
MEKMKKARAALALMTLMAMAPAVRAGSIMTDNQGTSPPAATLGGYVMTPFAANQSAVHDFVTSLTTPNGGTMGFETMGLTTSQETFHASWSDGYTGDEYAVLSPLRSQAEFLTLILPADTLAFYFYAVPDQQAIETITATAQDGTSLVENNLSGVGANGASYFGFYATGGDRVTSITISDTSDFLIGQFAIAEAVPLPSTALIGGMLLAGLGAFQLRRRKVCA